MPRIAAEIEAVTSPSWISLMRAPAARISSIRSWWRGRSSTIVVMSFALPPEAVGDRVRRSRRPAAGGRSLPARAGPTAIWRMYMSGRRRSEPGGPTAIIDMAPLPPRATTPRPSSGSRARSNASPPCADLDAGLELAALAGADDDRAVDGQPVERRPHRPLATRPRRRPGRRGRASGQRRAPPAPSPRAKSSQRTGSNAGVLVRPALDSRATAAPARSSTSSITAPIASPTCLVLDHRHVVPPRPLDDVVLDAADLRQARQVLVDRPHAVRERRGSRSACGGSPRRGSRARTGRRARARARREHPRHEVDALQHHRPALVERPVERRLDADEHVARLVEEAEQRRVARSSSSAFERRAPPRSSSSGSTA